MQNMQNMYFLQYAKYAIKYANKYVKKYNVYDVICQ